MENKKNEFNEIAKKHNIKIKMLMDSLDPLLFYDQ